MQEEESYMMRCLTLARAGASSVAPNPMVGAVVTYRGRIIGEGYHRRFGEPHAEVNAIASVREESWLRSATLYVNLEPCSHYGKTPPCTELIIRKRIPRVVIGCRDPYPEVAGRGISILRKAGVEVITGVLEQEAVALNVFFITAQTRQRPYIILKWAQSADGFIDRIRTGPSERPTQLSTPVTRRMVHKLRSEVAAVLVGTQTAWLDNPSLTVRHWAGASPVRVLIDRNLRIPSAYHLLDGSVRTLVFTGRSAAGRPGVEYIRLDFSQPVIPQMLLHLYNRQLYSLLVEGGARLHRSFLASGLWDELQVETVSFQLGNGIRPAEIQSDPTDPTDPTVKHLRTVCFPVSGQASEIAFYAHKHSDMDTGVDTKIL
ncbi:MAG: bifunctional diaminohydroxyphosphoribosylaminopyrimidine deaminase/5-amino-6-(5-phosphoribosylamino)uracil reductase RibD [Tannerella sp.]|jgi:diaminohydroxyphosphoribosylaminopyrimidine deaminase/5-amino-6-(5-phosphoribosylamino)uracil reductase|nr:bifunctional diaminohydroxyphosphoribosylaminopyrimidine deaminase/5-amino-6-(5-phosphoribosylamino)uracil reductase RibD [Tannerella sp.]